MVQNKITPAAPPVAPGRLIAPDYMTAHHADGTEALKSAVIPPRLKVVQPTSREPFCTLFSQGDIVVVPMMQRVSEYDKQEKRVALYFATVFFWHEWCCWNPLAAAGQLKSVRDRSLDPKSSVAIKARDEERRNAEICPEVPEKDGKKQYLSYVEHLNFMIVPFNAGSVETQFAGLPICLSFARGEWIKGSNMSGLIMVRRAPIYGCQFQATVRRRTNNKGTWFGIDVDNPDPTIVDPWVGKDSFDAMQKLYTEFKTAHAEKTLQVDYEDVEEEIKPGNSKEF